MRDFHWHSAVAIPAAWDLRRCGWQLAPTDAALHDDLPILAPLSSVDAAGWMRLIGSDGPRIRGRVLLLGANDPAERARLLRLGFGDVAPGDIALAEVDARAARIATSANALPRFREVDGLLLDLLARDAFADGRPIGLHPREFALLWRLADTPGIPVSKAELVSDVWRLGHVPETNSIAVHVSRLRTKLAIAGYDALIHTAPGGGYVLVLPGELPLFMETLLASRHKPMTLRMFLA